MDKTVMRTIDTIAANHSAGAEEIAEQGADVFLHFARTNTSITVDDFRHELLHIGWSIIRAQPTMAPLVNLVNAVLWAVERAETLHELRQTTHHAATTFKHQIHVREAAIAEIVLPLISERAQVLTLSRSTTVKAALRYAQHAGRRFRVVCAEGRPGYEGRKMAHELSDSRIPVSLIVDALALSYVSQVEVVLVGADHLTETDLVNKAGTYGLSLAAQDQKKPIYALCGSSKFLPPGYTAPPQAPWPPEQVWPEPPSSVVVENLYFDHTPLNYMSGIVTEKGVLTTAGIEAWLASIKLHPALKHL